MHEMALADAVIKTALHAAEKEGLQEVRRIVVRIGELQNIKPDVFEFALTSVKPPDEPRLRRAEIVLEIQPARFECRPCKHRFGLADTDGPLGHDAAEAIHFIPELAHAFLSCPACGSPDFELIEGRGVTIEAIEGQ